MQICIKLRLALLFPAGAVAGAVGAAGVVAGAVGACVPPSAGIFAEEAAFCSIALFSSELSL